MGHSRASGDSQCVRGQVGREGSAGTRGDGELTGLSENSAQLIGALDEVDLVTLGSDPTAARGVHVDGVSLDSVDLSEEHLLGRRVDLLIGDEEAK